MGYYSIIKEHSQVKRINLHKILTHTRSLMREREEVFDHFITAVINTLNADEIYDAAIEALQDIL